MTPQKPFPEQHGRRWAGLAAAALALLVSHGHASAQSAMAGPTVPPPRDQRLELQMKIREPFTLAAVGDLSQFQPFSTRHDPDIQALVSVMRAADVTVANNENIIVDLDNYTGPDGGGDGAEGDSNLAGKDVAQDWANMGVDMVTKANNHALEAGEAGLFEDFKQLEAVGIRHVGAGRSLQDARQAAYLATPKGSVAMIGVYALNTPDGASGFGVGGGVRYVTAGQLGQLRAMRDSIVARRGEVRNPIALPARDPEGQTLVFGVTFKVGAPPPQSPETQTPKAAPTGAFSNMLHVTASYGVTAAQMAELRAMVGDAGTSDTLSAFGQKFRVAAGTGEYIYEVNAADRLAILSNIRTAKQFSDFLVVQAHWHQNRYAFQQYSFDNYPADFERTFAHEAIDQGADVVIGHGVHTIKGVEIYKGKPIFYGLSNFVLQTLIAPRGHGGTKAPSPWAQAQGAASTAGATAAAPDARIVGLGEVEAARNNWVQQPDNLKALLASLSYKDGQLAEIRLYPADLGLEPRPGSQFGIPRRPDPKAAAEILGELAEYSKPFGVRVTNEDGVGIIRLPVTATK